MAQREHWQWVIGQLDLGKLSSSVKLGARLRGVPQLLLDGLLELFASVLQVLWAILRAVCTFFYEIFVEELVTGLGRKIVRRFTGKPNPRGFQVVLAGIMGWLIIVVGIFTLAGAVGLL